MDVAHERSYPTPYANSTFLPLLLMSLMQQKNTPDTNNTFKKEYDFIIVGAGSAGSVVASRLSEVECASVLLLEAGGAPPLLTEVPGLAASFWHSDISWGYRTVPQKHTAKAMVNNQVSYQSGKVLGGTSIFNGMLYIRGNRHNFDGWAEQGAVGWSYSDVLPYFYKAEDYETRPFLADGYHVVGGPLSVSQLRDDSEIKGPVLHAGKDLGYEVVDSNGRNQTGFFLTQYTMRNGQRCSTAKAYLVPAENRTNLDIVTKAFVHKVVIEKGRAVGVLFEREGETVEVRARKEVILSAGAVNSAQLLMLSGIGPKAHLEEMDIPVKADLPVGENFHDHCGTSIYFEMDPNIPNVNQKLQNMTNIQNYIDNRKGPLSSMLPDVTMFLTSPSNNISDAPDYQLFLSEAPPPPPDPSLGIEPEVIEKYFGPHGDTPLFLCGSFVLAPKSRGTIRLQSKDPRRPPLIDPNFLEADEDMASLVQGLKTCKQLGLRMSEVGSKPFSAPFPGCEDEFSKDDDEYFECVGRMTTMALWHAAGTAKMGHPRDPTTVVDPRLRVKGIEGLRVVDASIMPVVSSGNTNAVVIMLAEKASDLIKGSIDCPATQTPPVR